MSQYSSYRKFNSYIATVIVSMVAATGILNAAVDPYGIFGSPNFAGINALKPRKAEQSRMVKAAKVVRLKPQVVLMGTSRTDMGLDPDHLGIPFGYTALNLGLPGANMREVRYYFEHVVDNQPNLKIAVLGLDFFMFNDNRPKDLNFKSERLGRSNYLPADVAKVLFSLDALDASLETVIFNRSPSPTTLSDRLGQSYRYGQLPGTAEKRFNQMTSQIMKRPDWYGSYIFSEQALADLEAVIQLADERNIELHIFFSPSHAVLVESLFQAGLRPEWETWKRSVVALSPTWDFSGYNTITTEPVSSTMLNYSDSSHYTQHVGNLILNRIFAHNEHEVPSDFGVFLTPETFDHHQQQIASSRSRWLNSHSKKVLFVYNTSNSKNDLSK